MPYTLMKGLGWFVAALVIGIVIGWLIRSVTARRQVAKARAQQPDAVELERLRGRIANLEPVVAERDQLRAELEAARGSAARAEPDDTRRARRRRSRPTSPRRRRCSAGRSCTTTSR